MVNAGKGPNGAVVRSMTGYASGRGAQGDWDWTWDLRAVNARGLDLRLRVPDWIEGLETALRGALQGRIARGSVTLSLRLNRKASAPTDNLNDMALDGALQALAAVQARAKQAGVKLGKTNAADILSMRGVTEAGTNDAAAEAPMLLKALTAEIPGLIDAFDAMRAAEGAALAEVLTGQLAEIERLTAEAVTEAALRREQMTTALRENLARVLANSDGADEARVAQELAILAVKSDVTEEIDRLIAHVGAARALLADPGPTGRKLDFLTQEFNREANTLCSKAQSTALTRIGLDLKAVIDQMREQVQNVE